MLRWLWAVWLLAVAAKVFCNLTGNAAAAASASARDVDVAGDVDVDVDLSKAPLTGPAGPLPATSTAARLFLCGLQSSKERLGNRRGVGGGGG